MSYVLIIIVFTYRDAISVSQHTYFSKEACENAEIIARNMIKDVSGYSYRLARTACVKQ